MLGSFTYWCFIVVFFKHNDFANVLLLDHTLNSQNHLLRLSRLPDFCSSNCDYHIWLERQKSQANQWLYWHTNSVTKSLGLPIFQACLLTSLSLYLLLKLLSFSKLNGKLRLCVNYWGRNNLIIEFVYTTIDRQSLNQL